MQPAAIQPTNTRTNIHPTAPGSTPTCVFALPPARLLFLQSQLRRQQLIHHCGHACPAAGLGVCPPRCCHGVAGAGARLVVVRSRHGPGCGSRVGCSSCSLPQAPRAACTTCRCH